MESLYSAKNKVGIKLIITISYTTDIIHVPM